MIEIIYKCDDFTVVFKPAGTPSQSDPSKDADAMTLASELLTSEGENGKLWLIHRLDRVVGGLLVFARTKRAAAELSRIVSSGKLGKHYLAVAEGEAEGGVLFDYIYKDTSSSKAYVSERQRAGFKPAELEYSPLSSVSQDGKCMTLVDITLKTGRFHQIRAQFSSRKHPLVGDKKYGSRDVKAQAPALFAYKLNFTLCGKKYEFIKYPDKDKYPWSLFNGEYYDLRNGND